MMLTLQVEVEVSTHFNKKCIYYFINERVNMISKTSAENINLAAMNPVGAEAIVVILFFTFNESGIENMPALFVSVSSCCSFSCKRINNIYCLNTCHIILNENVTKLIDTLM